jgi:hypothetical protein
MLLRVYIHTGQAYFTLWPGIFFKPARCGYIYTQSNITQASYSPEYITPTQQISWLLDYTDIEGTRLSSEI